MRFQLTAYDEDAAEALRFYIGSARINRKFGNQYFLYLRDAEIRDLASDHNINMVVSKETRLTSGEKETLKGQIRDTARKAFLIAIAGAIRMAYLFELTSKVLSESAFLRYGVARCLAMQKEETPIIPGTNGRIYRASLDTDDYNIASLKSLPDDPSLSQMIAVHEINTASPEQQEDAQNRIQVANFIATHAQHEHMVKPFGSFALRSTYPGETRQYILTELHDADLSVFYQKYKPPSAADDWIRLQVRGLAAALALMHTPRDGNFAVHHGIKSQTIAIFSKQGFTCKLSLSTHCRILASDNSETISIPSIVTPYSPPESTRGHLTGRPHDIWSLGCVFLEMLVWCTQGQKGYQAFIEVAGGKHVPQYWFREEGGETVLQKIVKQQLNTLQAWEQGKWVNLVLVIRRMLAIDVSTRITASQLVAALNSSTRPI